MRKLQYWIKERDNPQLGTYYVACGQMTKAEAKKPKLAWNTARNDICR